METRRTVTHILFTILFFWGVFFILPSVAFAEETSAKHAQLGIVIIDRYTKNATMSFTDDERAWMQWGVEHEGIPARALHHKEKNWMHDSVQQSAPVYEGVYTWEQGIADYAQGEKQRAFGTLGHLLHLVIDAHPTALSSAIASERRKMPIRTWRDVVTEENARNTVELFQEGVDTLQRFFAEAQVPKVQRSDSLTVFFTKASFILQERVGFARMNIQRAFHGIRIAFARVPPPSSGGVVIPELQMRVAHAEQEEVKVQENKKVQATAPVPVAPVPLPFATSVPLPPPPIVQEQVPLDVPEIIAAPIDIPVVAVEPIIVIQTPQDTVPQIPEPLSPPPPPTPPREELDVYGFPLGTVRTYNRAPPETTIETTPEQLTRTVNATFAFTSSKEGTFFCMIDHGEEQACTSPVNYSGLLDGNHTFAVRARDIWGTYDATPEIYAWTIDTAPPLVVDTTPPSAPTLVSPTTGANYTTIATTVTIAGTREDGATIAIDGVSDGITTPTGTTWGKAVTLVLGTTTFSITATDAAGNMSAPTTLTITRTENHAPTTISNLAITTSITTNDRFTLTWTTPSDADIPTQALTYFLHYATTQITDEAAWSAATNVTELPAVGASGTAETFTVTGLTPATTYYFVVRTSDGELLSSLSNTPSATTHYGVRITDAHFQGGTSEEYIDITNERNDSRSLQGWTLRDTSSHIYPFPVFILAPGATVRVHTVASTDTSTNTQTDLYWKHSAVWNDSSPDMAFLKDSSGALIDSVSW